MQQQAQANVVPAGQSGGSATTEKKQAKVVPAGVASGGSAPKKAALVSSPPEIG